MSGNFLSCSKDPFEFPEVRCDEPPDTSEEMGLIPPGGETSWILPSCGRFSRVMTGPQGPALVASGKDSPHASRSGASWDSCPVNIGA